MYEFYLKMFIKMISVDYKTFFFIFQLLRGHNSYKKYKHDSFSNP